MIRCPFPFFVQPDIRSRERTTRCGGSVGLVGGTILNPIKRIPWQRCSIYEVSRDPRLRSSSLDVRSSSGVVSTLHRDGSRGLAFGHSGTRRTYAVLASLLRGREGLAPPRARHTENDASQTLDKMSRSRERLHVPPGPL